MTTSAHGNTLFVFHSKQVTIKVAHSRNEETYMHFTYHVVLVCAFLHSNYFKILFLKELVNVQFLHALQSKCT